MGISLADTLGPYRRSLRAENRAPRTITAYLETVGQLVDFIGGDTIDVAALTRGHIEKYLADQAERWKPATASVRYRALQRWTTRTLPEPEVASYLADRWPGLTQ